MSYPESPWGVSTMVTRQSRESESDDSAKSDHDEVAVATVDDTTSMMPLDEADKGMTLGYKLLYSGKEDKKGQWNWQTTIPEDLGKPAEDAESERWAIVARRARVYGHPKKVLALHSIVVQSPVLKNILKDVLAGYPGVTVALRRLQFSGQFEPLIHRWDALRERIADEQKKRDEGNADEETELRIQHAKLLDDLLTSEFSDLEEAMLDLKKNRVATFEHLWTIFQPGIVIFANLHNQDRAFLLKSAQYGRDANDRLAYNLTGVYVDFDGQDFGKATEVLSIALFKGTRRIDSLAAFPIQFHKDQENVRAKLVERGARVAALTGSYYRGYNGVGWRMNDYGGKEKHTVKGRIVIDPYGFNRFEPDHAVFVTSLNVPSVRASPISLILQKRAMLGKMPWESAPDDFGCTADDDDVGNGGGMPSDGFFDKEEGSSRRPALTEAQKLICTPFVRGYSLRQKKWMHFFVNAISDISFNDQAFSSLNLPKNQKDLILGFTSVKQSYRNQFDDVIEGKGKGIIILLSGPPGVGKTLTAESVAEQMKIPLYVMAAGDLGLDPRTVENRLQDTMAMCSRWGAILLLDEADIFLEERSLHELERNKLVSIFLRVLEYYEGIMFLTTNRVQTFDAAFQSRVHISLEYPELDKKARKAIWEDFLRRHDAVQAAGRESPPPLPAGEAQSQLTNGPASPAGGDALVEPDGEDLRKAEELHLRLTQPHQLSDRDVGKLADLKINGRQIKNFLKTAQLLAIYKEEPLSYAHVEIVVSTTQHLHKATEASDAARGAVYS